MKVLFFLVIFFIFSSTQADTLVEAPEKPTIIPRASWGANELYTSRESSYWQDILESWANYKPPYIDPEVKKKQEEDSKKSIAYINENFVKENTVVETIKKDTRDGFTLAWPLKYSETVNAIIIHHTTGKYDSSLEAMEKIYKYHSLSRAWGDIGYHYLIGYDGEIFEGRKGGDYVSGAHSVWNNMSTVGISVIGDYDETDLNEAQYESLKKLVTYLTWRYGIDTSKNYYYHTGCAGTACKTFPLETYQDSRLVGHRDTGHTSCPGDKLAARIEQMRPEIDAWSKGFQAIKRGETPSQTRILEKNKNSLKLEELLKLLEKFSQEDKQKIYTRIETRLENEDISEKLENELKLFRIAVKLSMGN